MVQCLIRVCWEQEVTLPPGSGGLPGATSSLPLPGSNRSAAEASDPQTHCHTATESSFPAPLLDSAPNGRGRVYPSPRPPVAAGSHNTRYSDKTVAAGSQQVSAAAVSQFARPSKGPSKPNSSSSSIFLQRCQGSRKRPRLDPQSSCDRLLNPSSKQEGHEAQGARSASAVSNGFASLDQPQQQQQQLHGMLNSHMEVPSRPSLQSHPLGSMVMDDSPPRSRSGCQESLTQDDMLMDSDDQQGASGMLPEGLDVDASMLPGRLAQPASFRHPPAPKKDMWLPLVLTGMPAQTIGRRSHDTGLPAAAATGTVSHGRRTCQQAPAAALSVPALTEKCDLPSAAGSRQKTPGRKRLHELQNQPLVGPVTREAGLMRMPQLQPSATLANQQTRNSISQPRTANEHVMSETTAPEQLVAARCIGEPSDAIGHVTGGQHGVGDKVARPGPPDRANRRMTRLLDQPAISALSTAQLGLPKLACQRVPALGSADGSEGASSPLQPPRASASAAAERRKSGRQRLAEDDSKPWWVV